MENSFKPMLKWRKAKYDLVEDKANEIIYLRRKGDVVEYKIDTFYSENNNILLDLLNVDESIPSNIVCFCNKYGRLGIAHLSSSEVGYPIENYYSDFETMPTDFPDSIKSDPWHNYKYYAPETIGAYKRYIREIKAILELYEAIEEKNYAKICDKILFLLTIRIGSNNPLYNPFNNPPYSAIVAECIKYVGWPEVIGGDDLLFKPGETVKVDFEPWYSGKLEYNDDFSMNEFIKHKSHADLHELFRYGQQLCAEIVSKEIESVSFSLEIDSSGKFQDYWTANSLSAIVYYALFLKISRRKIIRICANVTCNAHFEVKSDSRKIYCNHECADRQTTRNYRKRKASNKKKAVKEKLSEQ